MGAYTKQSQWCQVTEGHVEGRHKCRSRVWTSMESKSFMYISAEVIGINVQTGFQSGAQQRYRHFAQ